MSVPDFLSEEGGSGGSGGGGGGGGGGCGATSVLLLFDACPEAFKVKTARTKIAIGITNKYFCLVDLMKVFLVFIIVNFC